MSEKKKKIKKNVVSIKENSIEPKVLVNHENKENKEILDSFEIIYDIKTEKLQKELHLLQEKLKYSKDDLEKEQIQNTLQFIQETLEKQLSKDLIVTQIDKILDDLVKIDIEKDIELYKDYKEKIRLLLKIYNEKNLKNAFDILNIKTIDDIFSQDKSLKRNIVDYKAFVYYFWDVESNNFSIIGLRHIYPLFEILETQEMFFLDNPTLTTSGLPIFWLVKGVPLAQKIVKNKDYIEMDKLFTLKGYNASQIDVMVKAPLFIRIFGLNKIPMKTWFLIIFINILIIAITVLICHTIYK